MALSYTNLFGSISAYVSAVLTARGWVTKCDTIEAGVAAPLATADEYDLLANIPNTLDGHRSTLTQIVTNHAQSITNLLADTSLVLDPMGLSTRTSRTSDVLTALFSQMLTDSQTVLQSAMTAGSVTADGANVGNPTLLVDAILDGAVAPATNAIANRAYAIDAAGKMPGESSYAGRASELISAASFVVTCSADSQTSGNAVGSESFSVFGGDAPSQPFDWQFSGAGAFTMTMANNSTLLQNGSFETWTGTGNNTPTGWTLGTGAVAGTTIINDSVNIYRGLGALQVLGTGASTIILSQSLVGDVKPLTRYCVAVRVKTSGAGVSAGTLTIAPSGTGYTAETTGEISLDHTALAGLTSYALKHFWFTAPQSVPADFALTISVTGTLTAGQKIYLDDLMVVQPTRFAGLSWCMVAGSMPVLIGDTFTVATTGTEGVLQKFFREWFGFQLPSAGSGSNTISDSVAAY